VAPFKMSAGGKGANQAVTIARLGGNVTFISKIGDDIFGKNTIKGYKNDKIDTKFIYATKDTPSGIALINVDRNGENSIAVAPGANDMLTLKEIENAKSEILSAEYILLQLEIPLNIVEYVINLAKENGIKVILNPAPAKQLPDNILSNLFLITPNKSECELLTGVNITNYESAIKAGEVLIKKGIKNVIITLGSKGSIYINKDSVDIAAAKKVEAVDTTAAGDVFNGALCVYLSEGHSITEAIKFATTASAISVTRIGAQPSIPLRSEVDALL
jgi:ribokinase